MDKVRTFIPQMIVGNTYTNTYALKQCAVKQTRQNTTYLDVVFSDKDGEIAGKMWSIPSYLKVTELMDSSFILAQFVVEEYQGNKQARIQNIRPAREGEITSMDELLPIAPESPQSMYDEIMNTVKDMKNSDLQKVVTEIYVENKSQLLRLPGAKSMHHAVIGGLLYHTVGMLRVAKSLASIYSGINSDLLFAGVILHDIAKIREFETNNLNLVVDYTAEGKLLGHVFMGAEYVGSVCDRCSVDPEIKLLLKHMILSHHGKPEHGSAITPSFLEAELLYICDYTDSRIYMYKEAVNNIDNGEFSPKVFGLDNKQIYKPKKLVNDNNPMVFIEDNISDLF